MLADLQAELSLAERNRRVRASARVLVQEIEKQRVQLADFGSLVLRGQADAALPETPTSLRQAHAEWLEARRA